MNKCIKVLLIISSVLFSLGLIIIITGVLCGGNIKDAISLSDANRDVNLVSVNKDFSKETIRNLKLDVSAGKVYIKEGKSFRVEGENLVKDSFEIEVRDNTLYVNESDDFNWSFVFRLGVFFDGGESKITITVPSGFVFDNTEIEVKAGKVDIDKFSSNTFDLQLDAGRVDLDNTSVTSKASIKLNAGAVKAKDYNGKNLEVEVSAGSCDLSGAFYETLDLSCSAGSINIESSLSEEEYSYDLDQTAGSIRINGDSYKEYNNTNKEAKNSIVAKCDAGSIKIDTK